MKVLLAEDDPHSLDFLQVRLRHWGYEVVTASNGLDALEVLRTEAPPLALLDWMMPRLDGVEVCRRAREDPELEGRYLVLVTARADVEDRIHGLEAGADDYLVKPVDVAELRSRLRVGERVVRLQNRLATQVQELQAALDQVKTLEGLIPICSYCKNVRNEEDYWERVEQYLTSRSEARFSHGICPSCLARLEEGELE